MGCVGESAADARPPVIDRAAARFGIEELACHAEYRILLASQNSFILVHLCMTLGRHLFANAKVFCQPFQVAFINLHAIVDRTAIRRAFRAVEIAAFITIKNSSRHKFPFRLQPCRRYKDWLAYRLFDLPYSETSNAMNSSRRS